MLFVATGGTIDKLPALLPDGSFDNETKLFGRTHLPEMLRKAHFFGERSIHTVFMLDSLDMTDDHREIISGAIQSSPEAKVVVTHGTDTMPETAQFLALNSELAARTIVLTGAMIPFSMGKASDAVPNLRAAIGFAQKLEPGVFVAMNGQPFDAHNVRKDREAGVFRTLE